VNFWFSFVGRRLAWTIALLDFLEWIENLEGKTPTLGKYTDILIKHGNISQCIYLTFGIEGIKDCSLIKKQKTP